MWQQLGSAQLADGTVVAYATAGNGPPLLFIGGWLSHLELSWALPAERQFFEGLARGRTLLRYDRVGCGMSDRPAGHEYSIESELATIDAVVDASGITTTDIIGSSLGVPLAIEWAARHPERVNRLVLYGGWARGTDIAPEELRQHVVGVIKTHWGLGAEVITEIFAPESTAGTRATVAAYQREASSAATAASLLEFCYRIDVTGSLETITTPTLVVHRDHDRAAPIAQSELIASTISGARLEILPGRSHLPYIGDADTLVAAIRSFLGLPKVRSDSSITLTARQREIAALVSDGLTNKEIGERLGITERSAEGHLERIRLRLDVRSRAQIAAWWVATSTTSD